MAGLFRAHFPLILSFSTGLVFFRTPLIRPIRRRFAMARQAGHLLPLPQAKDLREKVSAAVPAQWLKAALTKTALQV
jgi:hypothetical protein